MTDNEIIKYLESLLDRMRAYESEQTSIGKGLVISIIAEIEKKNKLIEIADKMVESLKAEVKRLKAEADMADGYADALEAKAKSEAIKEFQHKSESTLIKLYDEYHRIANRPNSAWFKRFTKEENEMFYQGRAEAIWECISVNRDIVKEMVGDDNANNGSN